jgi:hypothetical protein
MIIFTRTVFIFLFFVAWINASSQNNTPALPDDFLAKLSKCSFQIQEILNSHDNQFMAIAGIRKCADKSYREVVILKNGTWINNSTTNTFLTENMAPVEIKWIGDKLYVFQQNMRKTLMKNELVFGSVVVVYPKNKKSFY